MTRICVLLMALCGAVALWAAELPITDVVLFSSGVGYVQRTGSVKGNATVQLTFKPGQVNDLLKSLVLLDLDGGQVGAVTYGAKDPVSKTLQAFAVNITDNPTMGQLLNRLRGVPVEVMAANKITGKILGVETKQKEAGDKVVTFEVLNLLTDEGLRSVRLDEVTAVRLLDDKLNKELQDALVVLASGLDNQRKPVVINFTGAGERKVVVGYLNEAPIWKTSYRLVLGEKQNEFQGWAVVENTSDADWTNIHLSLVSGRPISFIEDLYTPLYVPRPLYQPELFASLGPVNYGANLEANGDETYRTQNNFNGNVLNGPQGLQGPQGMPGPAGKPQEILPPGYAPGDGSTLMVKSGTGTSVVSAATAQNLGEAFEYTIKDPVNLPRQQSALLPIITGTVGAWKVSIYNPQVHAKFPLYGLRVKNTTGMHLMGGPITVYDGNVYAGDAVFEDLQPGEQRLVSYAVDLGVEGEAKCEPAPEELIGMKLVKGALSISRKFHRTTNYTFKVKDDKDRLFMVEHPYENGWTLLTPEKPDERTDKLYRFRLTLNAKDGAKLDVVEERVADEAVSVINMDTPTVLMYIKTGKMSQGVKDALQKVVDQQTALLETGHQRGLREQEIKDIADEQNRIRQTMGQLDRNSDLYKRYITKLDQQETRIDTLRGEIKDLQAKEETQRKELETFVGGLDIN